MYITDKSSGTDAWNKKYVLDDATYCSYAAYVPFVAGNTGIEHLLSYFKKEWIPYDHE